MKNKRIKLSIKGLKIFFQKLKIKMKIIWTGVLLVLFGVLAVYSVSTYESFHTTLLFWDPSNFFYFSKHIKNIAISLIVALVAYRVSLKFLLKDQVSRILFWLVFILQLAVFIPWIWENYNWAKGWISLPFMPNMQPSELFKIGYVFFMTTRLTKKKEVINKKEFLWQFLIINLILLWVFLFVPDLWTILILGLIGLVMVFYAGLSHKTIWIIVGSVMGGLLLIIWLFSAIGGWDTTANNTSTNKFSYVRNRLLYFINPNIDPQGKEVGRQNKQALYAIWGGWLIGEGYGKGLQKFGFLPEAQSDFIFAAFSEEIGFVGNLILLSLYFYLMYYFISKLKNIRDEKTKLLWIGIISIIIIQMFINIGVNIRIIPNTGVTLPFISHWGTALMANFIELIILYKITRIGQWFTSKQ